MFNLIELFQNLKNLFLDRACVNSNENIIAIDWSKAASGQYYQMAANTRVVGRMLGCIINRLKADLKLDPNLVYLIGHSLGPYIIAYGGRMVNPRCKQAVLTDPGGNGFEEFQVLYPEAGVLPSDAQCVLVIHTFSNYKVVAGMGGLLKFNKVKFILIIH